MTVNGVKILKGKNPSLSVGRVCPCSKTVSRMVPVTDLESMA